MGTVSSLGAGTSAGASTMSAGMSDLMQALTSATSPLSSMFSSPALQSALQNASPADVVQLSDAAMQLQDTDEMFGVSNTSDSSSSSNLLSAFTPSTTASGGTSSTSAPTMAQQIATEEANFQQEQASALFSTNSDGTNTDSSNSLNILG